MDDDKGRRSYTDGIRRLACGCSKGHHQSDVRWGYYNKGRGNKQAGISTDTMMEIPLQTSTYLILSGTLLQVMLFLKLIDVSKPAKKCYKVSRVVSSHSTLFRIILTTT